MGTPEAAAARARSADKLDRLAHKILLSHILMIPVFLVVASDFVTRWAGTPRRYDALVMVALLFSVVSGQLALRQAARWLRRAELAERPTRLTWAKAAATPLLTIAFVGAIGYLFGGWITALILPLLMIVLMALAVLGTRQRIRRRAAALEEQQQT